MATSDNRKSDIVRRANRVIQQRTFILSLILGIAMFALLFAKLYQLQVKRHEELQQLAVSQQTRSEVISASRGTIYDRNGNILAISASAETIFLSPMEINEDLEASAKATDPADKLKWTKDSLAADLARMLNINEESVRKRMDRVDSQYEVIKLKADEELAGKVREYAVENNVRGLYLVTDTKRYYPYSTLAAHVIGFVGDDNIGLYGLEAHCEENLEGQTGLIITAKDNAGNDMLYEFEQHFDPKNGLDHILTIDATVQYYLQNAVEEIVHKYKSPLGGQGIVLNAKTGAVLAMASYPTYDLNDFTAIQDADMKKAIADKKATVGEMQMRQWWNKCLNEVYEPGSTFKPITLAAALEEGVVDMDTTYTCSGSIHVADATIHCSGYHGHQVLKETAANSCNPAFITYGLQLGTEKYYEYMKAFGLMDGSGVDLDGEGNSVFISPDHFTELDLACYAFGQNFNITPIALIAAQAACVNGGYLYQPYVVDRLVDDDGNVVWQHDNTPIRQVVSEETSAKVRECLEYVVSDGTGTNGQVAGYRIGGKTGTADKGKTGDVIVSFMSFAPADDPQVIMLITLDSPSNDTGTYPSGGNMVAPACSKVMSEILPYLGIEPSYSAEELLDADTTVPNVIGMSVEDAKSRITERYRNLGCKVIGDGDTITDQTPEGGSIIPGKSVVILYAGAPKPQSLCTVPNLIGRTPSDANQVVTNAGLLIRFTGTTNSGSSTIRVISQSEPAASKLPAGSVITVQLGDTSARD